MNSNENRLDRIERLVEQNAEQISRTQRQVDSNSQAIATLLQTTQQMLTLQQQESQQFTQSLNSINAAIERIDRVLNYLLRQQNRSDNQ